MTVKTTFITIAANYSSMYFADDYNEESLEIDFTTCDFNIYNLHITFSDLVIATINLWRSIMDKKLENRIARLEKLLSNSNSKPRLEQRIDRLEKLLSRKVRNEARAPKSIGDTMVNAIFKGDANKVMSLLDAGADPDCRNSAGMTALFAAANCHEYAIAKVLLDAGADPNASITSVGVDWYGDNEDIDGEETPLSSAEYDDDSQMVALLKRYGAR